MGRICEWYSGLNSNLNSLRIPQTSAPLREFRPEMFKNAKIQSHLVFPVGIHQEADGDKQLKFSQQLINIEGQIDL